MVFPLSVQRPATGNSSEFIPGACVYACPPSHGLSSAQDRTEWAFVTMGLTQPKSPEAVAQARSEGIGESGRGSNMLSSAHKNIAGP